jgi:hypothetical protein
VGIAEHYCAQRVANKATCGDFDLSDDYSFVLRATEISASLNVTITTRIRGYIAAYYCAQAESGQQGKLLGNMQ